MGKMWHNTMMTVKSSFKANVSDRCSRKISSLLPMAEASSDDKNLLRVKSDGASAYGDTTPKSSNGYASPGRKSDRRSSDGIEDSDIEGRRQTKGLLDEPRVAHNVTCK